MTADVLSLLLVTEAGRSISVEVDDDLFTQIESAYQNARAEVTANNPNASTSEKSRVMYLRRLVSRAIDDPRPLFDAAFLEGYRTAFADTIQKIAAAIARVAEDPAQAPGLGVDQGPSIALGVSFAFDERGGRRSDGEPSVGRTPRRKPISISADAELFIRVNHAHQAATDQLGIGRMSKSVYLRRLLSRAVGNPQPLYAQGGIEGQRAAFSAAIRTVTQSVSKRP